MHVGYFLNQSNLGWKKSFTQVLQEGREIAQYCDRTGWDSIWTTEHHFGHEGYEVCTNPVMMSTDLAARTERIRIGQAANIITFHNPIQLAEDLATLDHMCDGRLEVGVGRGLYPRESLHMNPVGDVRNADTNRALFAETLEVMKRAWTQEFFSFKGEFFEYPMPGVSFPHDLSPPLPENTDPDTGNLTGLNVLPKPSQAPYPPLSQVVDTPPSIANAGASGLNALFWIPPTDALVPRFEMFRDAASEAEGREVPLGERCGVLRDMFVTETMAEAERLAGRHMLGYLEWVCHFRGLGNHLHVGEELPATPGKLDLLDYQWLHPRNMLFGTPEYIAEKIHDMKEQLNLQRLLLWSSFPGLEHEAAMDSIVGFTEQVMPLIRDEPDLSQPVPVQGRPTNEVTP